jgi:hypothetical protein
MAAALVPSTWNKAKHPRIIYRWARFDAKILAFESEIEIELLAALAHFLLHYLLCLSHNRLIENASSTR